MAIRVRRAHSGFQGASSADRDQGREDAAGIGAAVDVHASQIKQRRDQLLEGTIRVFDSEARPEPQALAKDVKTLHAKIGELTLVNDFLESALDKAGLLSAKR